MFPIRVPSELWLLPFAFTTALALTAAFSCGRSTATFRFFSLWLCLGWWPSTFSLRLCLCWSSNAFGLGLLSLLRLCLSHRLFSTWLLLLSLSHRRTLNLRLLLRLRLSHWTFSLLGLTFFLAAIDWSFALDVRLWLNWSRLRLRGAAVSAFVSHAISAFVFHLELLTLASIRNRLDTPRTF